MGLPMIAPETEFTITSTPVSFEPKALRTAVNRRVASSNLARGAIPYDFANLGGIPPTRKLLRQVSGGGRSLP